MIPTLVITLREGVEAALIVGIIAAFLVRQGRADALRFVWFGVAIAALLCLGIAVALKLAGNELGESAQEGLSSVVTIVAVVAVTYMIVWMSAHARELRGRLEQDVSAALAGGSTWALVGMAFFAVLREGFETTIFLVALFDQGADATSGIVGALLGLIIAIGLGWGLYRGGVRLDLARFFRITAAVLVLVAAGLVASALGAAAEADWLAVGQAQALDLSWLLVPGSVQESLVTGMLGIPAQPTVIQLIAYVAYAIPMLLFVLAPADFDRRIRGMLAGAAVSVAPVALIVGFVEPGPDTGGSAAGEGARTVEVGVSAAGCEPASLRLSPGPVTFEVASSGSSAVTEFEVLDGDRVIGEAENLTAGLAGSFSATLRPGSYELRCPGGSTAASGELIVSGARRAGSDAP